MIEAIGLLTAALLFLATVGGLVATYTGDLRRENARLRAENERLAVQVAQAPPAPLYPGYAEGAVPVPVAPHLNPYPLDERIIDAGQQPAERTRPL